MNKIIAAFDPDFTLNTALDGLGNGLETISPAIDTESGGYHDILLTLAVVGNGTEDVVIHAQAAGSDGVFDDAANDRLIGSLRISAGSGRGHFAVAHAFGGVLPRQIRFRLVNESGDALAASGNALLWRGLYWMDAPA